MNAGLYLGQAASSWHYGAWVAIDVRLFVFVMLVSVLAATGITLWVAKRRHWIEVSATFIVSFTLTFVAFLSLLNGLSDYPVFAIRSMFPFP